MTLEKIIAGLNEAPKKEVPSLDREAIGNSIQKINRPISESYKSVIIKDSNTNPAE